MTLGQKITNLRKARGMTQEELSESVGVTRQTISKWELDTSTPDLEYLCKLCDLFGVTADYLIRPERETVEAAEAPASPEPAPTVVKEPAPSPKKPLNTRPAGWVLLGVAGIFLIVGLISLLTANPMSGLFVFAGIAAVLALELLLIRWEPLFIAMWTGWFFWSFVQFVLIASPYAVLAFSLGFIFLVLWVFYTAFCIGATVGVILKHVRAKRANR